MVGVEKTGNEKGGSAISLRSSEKVRYAHFSNSVCQSHFSTEKRAAAQKAEADFFLLLKEHKDEIHEGAVWKEVGIMFAFNSLAHTFKGQEKLNARPAIRCCWVFLVERRTF